MRFQQMREELLFGFANVKRNVLKNNALQSRVAIVIPASYKWGARVSTRVQICLESLPCSLDKFKCLRDKTISEEKGLLLTMSLFPLANRTIIVNLIVSAANYVHQISIYSRVLSIYGCFLSGAIYYLLLHKKCITVYLYIFKRYYVVLRKK